MKKKVMVLLVTAAMMVSAIGCGSKAADTTAPAAETSAADTAEAPAADDAATDTAAAGGDNTLTVWCWDPAFNIYSMQEAEKEYQKTNPDFKLNIVETPWEDIQTKLTTAGSAGDLSSLPDIMLMQDNAF